jgi:tetratricopeptide (TPR) repeat protein
MSQRPPILTKPAGPPTAAERWFRMGLELARIGRYVEALEPLEQALAYSVDESSPVFKRVLRSYYGVALALGRGDVLRGRRLCEESIADGTLDAELYVNLGRVYLKAGRRDLAVEAIETARAIDPSHGPAAVLQHQLGQRRTPFFSFLRRSHPANVVAGKLRARWEQSRAVTRDSGH